MNGNKTRGWRALAGSPRLRVAAVAGLALLAAGGGLAWLAYQHATALPPGIVLSNGRLEMTKTDIAVKYPGKLLSLQVHEGDDVTAGEFIAQEDDADTLAQLAGARAARVRAQAALEQAQGELGMRQGQAQLAMIDWQQSTTLHRRAMVSDVELEQRRIALDMAKAQVTAATGAVGEAQAAIQQAEAQIDQLSTVVADMHITTPTSGRVEYRIVEPGTVLPAGGKIISLVNPQDVYLTIFLPAAIAGQLRIGDAARIMPEGIGRAIPAYVSFVSPEAQFTPKFVETKSEREKLSYRVKLQIPADMALKLNGVLKAGMTADGYVRTDASRPWPQLGPEAQ